MRLSLPPSVSVSRPICLYISIYVYVYIHIPVQSIFPIEPGDNATGREAVHASKISNYGLSFAERVRLNRDQAGDGSGQPGGKYIPRAVREGWTEEEFYEIKISNVPEGMDRPDIKQLIDKFYEMHMHMRPPRSYRIRRKTSYRDDRVFFIVLFPSKSTREARGIQIIRRSFENSRKRR